MNTEKDKEFFDPGKIMQSMGSALSEIAETLKTQYGVKIIGTADISWNPPSIGIKILFDWNRLSLGTFLLPVSRVGMSPQDVLNRGMPCLDGL